MAFFTRSLHPGHFFLRAFIGKTSGAPVHSPADMNVGAAPRHGNLSGTGGANVPFRRSAPAHNQCPVIGSYRPLEEGSHS